MCVWVQAARPLACVTCMAGNYNWQNKAMTLQPTPPVPQQQPSPATFTHSLRLCCSCPSRYPLAIVKDLEPQRPTAANLLGIPVVLWKDGAGSWNCFEDRCPHRCVPCSVAYHASP